jgi:hypothetical protein
MSDVEPLRLDALLKREIDLFFREVAEGRLEIYNEISLQLELGIFLRRTLTDLKILFENPVDHFGWSRTLFSKKREIDISVVSPDKTLKAAIELKFPRNGQHPETMFKACQDLEFLEEIARQGSALGLFVMVVEDRLFYEGGSDELIYKYFRKSVPITGLIRKPTGKKDEEAKLRSEYRINWNAVIGRMKYCTVPVSSLAAA